MSQIIFTEQNRDGITTGGNFHITYQTTWEYFKPHRAQVLRNISLFTVYYNVENLQMRHDFESFFFLNETVIMLNAFISKMSDFNSKISTIFNKTRPTKAH